MSSTNVLTGWRISHNWHIAPTNSQAGGHLTSAFYSSFHWPTNWSSQIVPLLHLGTNRTESTAPHFCSSVISVGTCLFAKLLTQQWLLYICLSHGRCPATGLYTTVYLYVCVLPITTEKQLIGTISYILVNLQYIYVVQTWKSTWKEFPFIYCRE
jgi:hypothetical protein